MKKIISLILRGMPIIFACCIIFTTIMALIPAEDAPNPFNLWDKAQHALAFTTLALTGSFAYSKRTAVVYIGLILYGGGIEIAQKVFTTTRVGELSDLFADSVGIMIGIIIYLMLYKTFNKYLASI